VSPPAASPAEASTAGRARPGPQRRWTVAIDVGGTFTDATAVATDGEVAVAKVPSTPEDPAVALVAAVAELARRGVDPAAVAALFHGTTVATNATITGRLARVALITTQGYRDVLSYRTGGRPKLYDLQQPRPPELVPRRHRFEARERLAWNGKVVTPLDAPEIERLAGQASASGAEAFAVCLMFSYMNDAHERLIGAELRRRLPDTPVTLSSEIAREFREYPRTATTALNAGLRPIVGRYLLSADHQVRELGVRGPFLIMQSNGGCVPAARADAEAHRLLLSGPTAGVAGAVSVAAQLNLGRLISLDMGGTSLDVCLIQDGSPPVVVSEEVNGHPVLAPSVDVVTVGAGGGSIATVDAAGRLRVGPQSAGADPGPAAYGKGGTDATLTDAHVVTGTLGGTRLAGRLTLDSAAAADAVGRIADRLDMSRSEAADGIIAVGMANVVRAMRRVSVERGVDPRDCTLIAFGGAGPLHAGRLLREMGMRAVVIPPHPGLFSARGLIAADLRVDESQTVLRVLDAGAPDELASWYATASAKLVRRLRADGIRRAQIQLAGSADCRYLGQGFELAVPLRGLQRASMRKLAADFHERHRATYGHAAPGEAIEIVTLRLSAYGTLQGPATASARVGGIKPPPSAITGRRKVMLPGLRQQRAVPVLARGELEARNVVAGPAIIEEMDSTTLVLPGQRAEVDQFGNLWLREAR
jgi:N-methylhydantoinase A